MLELPGDQDGSSDVVGQTSEAQYGQPVGRHVRCGGTLFGRHMYMYTGVSDV